MPGRWYTNTVLASQYIIEFGTFLITEHRTNERSTVVCGTQYYVIILFRGGRYKLSMTSELWEGGDHLCAVKTVALSFSVYVS